MTSISILISFKFDLANPIMKTKMKKAINSKMKKVLRKLDELGLTEKGKGYPI